jgi:multiple sugar transport system ATP-binding protein
MAGIAFDKVWKAFGEKIAIRNLSFECADGEFLVILGHSGAGKTTIINLISGLEEISSGNIYFDGKLMNKIEPRYRDVAVAFENYSLYPNISVYNNIAFPLRAPIRRTQYTEDQIRSKVTEVAKLLKIEEYFDRMPRQLSGGQRQRVALARSLVRKPAVYLLDEAIAHLDAKLRHMLRSSLKLHARNHGSTLIYATPDQLEAVAMGDRVLVLFEGEIQQFDTPQQLYDFPANVFVATLVGEPPMNVVDFEPYQEDGILYLQVTNDIRIKANEHIATIISHEQFSQYRLGIRPTDIIVLDSPSESSDISANVLFSEELGNEVVIVCDIDGITLKSKIGEDEVEVTKRKKVWLKINKDKQFLFDRSTGKTLSPVKNMRGDAVINLGGGEMNI